MARARTADRDRPQLTAEQTPPSNRSATSEPTPALRLAGAHVDRGGSVRDRRRFWRRRLVALACLVALIAAVVVGLSGSHTVHGVSGAQPTTAGRLTLEPVGAQPRAAGLAAIVREAGTRVLVLQAHGLAPNNDNYYAVWLSGGPRRAELLGIVSPPVGGSGTFSSGTTLPLDSAHFHSLIVTVESSATPTEPGRMVLRAALPAT